MIIDVLSSSSKGNCYALRCADSVLLLEAGISLFRLRKKLSTGLSRVAGCFVTHEHGDHAGYVGQYWRAGVPVYMSAGTQALLKVGHAIPKPGKALRLNGWTVTAFRTKHDAADPVGYIVDSPDGERVVFATDTYVLPYLFPHVTVWMLECNYEYTLLKANMDADGVDAAQAKRILQSHMSVDHVVSFLKGQDLTATQAIYLLHGSERNLNKKTAAEAVRAATGKPVYIA